ncbi:MAG: peptidase S41 [Desulfuromonadales bacterium C00003094]|jgi:carboxyl-terminal processing protease|nr:MAG: peptidase S41 [Desulfuromonadales bacterium C00003094]OEU72511.1 MAG: peptidase S41 [Desulfuromonadales bacterium C00003107]
MQKSKRPTALALMLMLVLCGWLATSRADRAATAKEIDNYQELQLFTDVLSIIRRSYVEEVDMKELVYGAVNGMLASLDPHSSFMPPDVYKELKIDTSGEFGGLGIEITIRDGLLTVVSPIEGTPADRVGLQAGDMIVKIEDRFTKDISIMEAVKLMRGRKGTKVKISVMRESFTKPTEFEIVREIIKVKSVKARTLEDKFGYVRIAQFQERTQDDLNKALADLKVQNKGDLDGLVLDLRNNPGGLLDQAVKVSDTFLEQGLIVYTEGREEGSQMRFSAHGPGTEPDYPIVILINGGSASASEIVAGALQDNGRAVILGTQSFGKGSVQTIIPMNDDTGLRLTTARYFTPNGTSIQAKGIVPDILVKPMEIKEINGFGAFREKDLTNHINSPGADSAVPAQEPKQLKFTLDEKTRKDYQLLRALDLLKGWQILKGLNGKAA